MKQILHIIFVVCVDDKSESFLQSFFPVDFILELIEIHLVANLSREFFFKINYKLEPENYSTFPYASYGPNVSHRTLVVLENRENENPLCSLSLVKF